MNCCIIHLWLVYIDLMKVESLDDPTKMILDLSNNVNVNVFNMISKKNNQNH